MSRSILVVDDEPDLKPLVLQKYRKRIASGEFEFHFANDGEDALRVLDDEPGIELIATDINMPVMDGLTLLGHTRKLSRLTKTIIVSAYDDLENIRTAMNRGAYDFVTKPIDFADLERTIDKTLLELDELRKGREAREQLSALEYELKLATRIQRSILPEIIEGHKNFEIGATMLPARQVSGDFYDFFLMDQNRLGLAIGDVSGKGIPAALFMAVSRTLLRTVAMFLRNSSSTFFTSVSVNRRAPCFLSLNFKPLNPCRNMILTAELRWQFHRCASSRAVQSDCAL